MLGRQREVAVVTALLDRAAAGSGAALLLHGEPGIGKTTLLAEAQRLAARREMKTLTCSGVRAEARVPFAGLHQLLRPVLGLVAGLPGEQRDLLRAALGLDEHVLADLYRVALAALELLAVAAAQVPVLVVADDAHWLDRASADVLAFAARRIAAEPIAMVFSRRDGADNPFEWSGIPGLAVGALDADTSRSLLDRVAPQLPDEVRDRLLADAAGNPLALTELPATLRPDEPLPERLPVGDLLRQSFTTRLSELPARTQTLLLVVAADAGCRLGELCAAATIVYGSPVHEADIQPAIDARLVRLPGDKVAFCHPLIASAIYQSATVGGRQQVHTALAQVIPDRDDRRVWHLAAAALGPDDSVARELEALADRAARRGEAAVGAGRLAESTELLAGLAADLRDHPTPAVRYTVLFADAILADEAAAAVRFQAALAADPGGGELTRARLQLAYGSWLRRRRRLREAREVLAAAQETFTHLGASGFAYRAARELRTSGGVGRRPGSQGLAQLTPQERQIAQLVAQGLSNRQIGAQLFLSHRTVGSHLYHLFPKLGITTRSQLADFLLAAAGPDGGATS